MKDNLRFNKFNPSNPILACLLAAFFLPVPLIFAQNVIVSGAVVGNYTNLRFALNAINTGGGSGAVTVTINADHAITTTKCTLNQTNYTVLITANGDRTVTTALNDDLLLLNGADNVTITPGAGNSLVFTNSSSSGTAAAITLNTSANNNIINNVSLNGSTQGTFSNGVLNIRGNSDNNKIQNCKISGPAAARPRNCIVLQGTSTSATNDNTEITGCEISRFYVAGSYGEGIFSYQFNRGTLISGNHFFQPEAITVSTANTVLRCIDIQDGFWEPAATVTISNNFFGGSAINCGGAAWTMTSSSQIILTQPIVIHAGSNAGTGASIQGNTIQNFDLTHTNPGSAHLVVFDGILVLSGRATVGTTTPNFIGSDNGQNSIQNYASMNGTGSCFIRGIASESASPVSISNNKIGSFAVERNTSGLALFAFFGIIAYNSDACTISGNYIGSPSTANSITTNFANDKIRITGILVESGSYTVSNNTVKNLTNNAGWETTGIISWHGVSGKTFTCQNNTISTLTAGDGADNDVTGIWLFVPTNNVTYTAQITGNTISNLLATAQTDVGTDVVGIGIGQNNANIRAAGSCSNNNVSGISNLTSDINNSFTAGITAYTQFSGDFTFSGNTVSGIDSKTIDTYGMRVSDDKLPSSGIVTFTQNTIFDIETSQSGGLNFPTGLHLFGKNIIATRNKIYGLHAPNAPAGSEIRGIQAIGDGSSAYRIDNNFVSLGSDESNTVDIYGITNNTLSAINDLDIYYNSIFIGGSGGGVSAAFDRRVTSNVSGTIRNNIFYNARAGGLAISNTAVPPATGWNPGASNRNYLVSEMAGSLAKWGVSTWDLAGWRTASGGDLNSVSREIGLAGGQTWPDEFFVSHTTGNLGLMTGNVNEIAPVQNAGEVVGGVSTDFYGAARSGTPDIGGHEFATVLPLEWIDFQAVALENANRLEWTTASERELDRFEIERSADGFVFEKIGETQPAGGHFEQKYGFDDRRFAAQNWYRIRSVDLDGRSETTPVRFLAREKGGLSTAVIFPNPTAENTATLSLFSETEGEVELKICATNGQILRQEKRPVSDGQNQLELDLSGLPTGVFQVLIFGKTGVGVVRLVRI